MGSFYYFSFLDMTTVHLPYLLGSTDSRSTSSIPCSKITYSSESVVHPSSKNLPASLLGISGPRVKEPRPLFLRINDPRSSESIKDPPDVEAFLNILFRILILPLPKRGLVKSSHPRDLYNWERRTRMSFLLRLTVLATLEKLYCTGCYEIISKYLKLDVGKQRWQ